MSKPVKSSLVLINLEHEFNIPGTNVMGLRHLVSYEKAEYFWLEKNNWKIGLKMIKSSTYVIQVCHNLDLTIEIRIDFKDGFSATKAFDTMPST